MLELLSKFLVEHDQENEESKLKETTNIRDCDHHIQTLNGLDLHTIETQKQTHHTHEDLEQRKSCHVHEYYFALLVLLLPEPLPTRHVLLEVHICEDAKHCKNA